MTAQAPHIPFAVCDRPYCVWGWDLDDRNRQFIGDIAPDYFSYVSSRHLQELEGDENQLAAIAIRNNYHLAVETFFGLICATLQAPDFVPGWILRATTSNIRTFVKALDKENVPFPVKWIFDKDWSFKEISLLIHRNAQWSKESSDKTNERFAKLWSWIATDFLNDYHIKEYNSIKHGFRAKPGGFFMRAGVESELGVPAPESSMRSMGGSRFGSSFYSAEPISGDLKKSVDPHFSVRKNSLNWFPYETALKTELIALSMSNLQSFLMIENGKKFSEVQFNRPTDLDEFDKVWRTPGIMSSNMDVIVEEAEVYRATKEEILNALRRASTVEKSEAST